MNDSLRTKVFVCYYPETIACACIYLAARQLNLPLPESPNEDVDWWNVFRVKESSIRSICHEILQLYSREKPKNTKLESRLFELHELRRQQLEKRQLQREVARKKNEASATEGNKESRQNQKAKHKHPTTDAPDSKRFPESQNGRIFNDNECSRINSQEKRTPLKRCHGRHKSRSRTPKAYRSHTSRSPRNNHSKNNKHSQSRRDRHRRKKQSSSRSPSSDKHSRLYDEEKRSLSRRARHRLRSPIGHINSFGSGSLKLNKYNYYDDVYLNGRNKIRRN